jgi:hypothetical protein
MGLAQLFFKKGNYISTIELDVIVTESVSASVRMTENPVEYGANVNDHIIVEPMTFSCEGIVSNVSSSVVGQFIRAPSVIADKTKAKEAWDELLALRIAREPFTLVQHDSEYENIVLLTLNRNTDKDTANGLFFTATMKELIYVGAEIITSAQAEDEDTADKIVPTIVGGLKNLVGL